MQFYAEVLIQEYSGFGSKLLLSKRSSALPTVVCNGQPTGRNTLHIVVFSFSHKQKFILVIHTHFLCPTELTTVHLDYLVLAFLDQYHSGMIGIFYCSLCPSSRSFVILHVQQGHQEYPLFLQ